MQGCKSIAVDARTCRRRGQARMRREHRFQRQKSVSVGLGKKKKKRKRKNEEDGGGGQVGAAVEDTRNLCRERFTSFKDL